MKVHAYGIKCEHQLSYPVGNDLKAAVDYAFRTADLFKKIKLYQHRKVNVWCRGSSGAILAALFCSHILNETRILHIKKEGENAHSTHPRPLDKAINIIVDDFIDSGNTLRLIHQKIKSYKLTKIHVLVVENQGKTDENYIESLLGFVPSHLITNFQQ